MGCCAGCLPGFSGAGSESAARLLSDWLCSWSLRSAPDCFGASFPLAWFPVGRGHCRGSSSCSLSPCRWGFAPSLPPTFLGICLATSAFLMRSTCSRATSIRLCVRASSRWLRRQTSHVCAAALGFGPASGWRLALLSILSRFVMPGIRRLRVLVLASRFTQTTHGVAWRSLVVRVLPLARPGTISCATLFAKASLGWALPLPLSSMSPCFPTFQTSALAVCICR